MKINNTRWTGNVPAMYQKGDPIMKIAVLNGSPKGKYSIGTLFTIPSVRKKVGSKMNDGMIAPYKKVIEKEI